MGEIASVALLLALAVSLYAVVVGFVGGRRRRSELVASARNGVYVAFVLVSLALALMLIALATNRFEFAYVYGHTSRSLPLFYRLTALYAGNEGSLLLWAWLASLFALLVVVVNRGRNREFMPYVYTVAMATQAFFLVLVTLVVHPFTELARVPPDGVGLNPPLQNFGMVLHPPTLYAGYAAFAIPFGFAFAALVTGRLGSDWIRASRRWALVGWCFLTIGNLVGAWWAYVELSWGGYYAWEAGENASLLPWLVATATIHSMSVSRKRGAFRVWTLVLLSITFALTIFSSFITRGGVPQTTHTWEGVHLSPFFLGFAVTILVVGLGLVGLRWRDLGNGGQGESLVSRETSFLLNNVVLLAVAVITFVGTVAPALGTDVRTAFFNRLNGPILLTLVFLMGLCPLIAWRKSGLKTLGRRLLYPAVVAMVVGLVLAFTVARHWYAAAALGVLAFVGSNVLYEWFRGVRARRRMRGGSVAGAFGGLVWANRPRYGGYVVHLAILLVAVGVVGTGFFRAEAEAVLAAGESMTVKGYTVTCEHVQATIDRDRVIYAADVSVQNGGKLVARMQPAVFYQSNFDRPESEVAIRTTPADDLWVALNGWDLDRDIAILRVVVNPLILWIWVGGGVLVLGTVIAVWPDRSDRRRGE